MHHVFLLILTMAGQPERIAAVCDTYEQCSTEGADIAKEYQEVMHKSARDISYRVVQAVILPGSASK